jgi:hypothetical protein
MPRAKLAPTSVSAWRLGPVVIAGDPRPIEHLTLFLDGWTLAPARGHVAPDIEIAAEGEAFIVTARGEDTHSVGAMDAANAVAGAAIAVLVAREPDVICLHAAAAEFAGRVVALVGDTGAGKSSVALLLAAAGRRLWGDDRVGLRLPSRALALGLTPKMRWPLPPSDETFARFIDDRAAWWGETAAILRMRPGEAAPRDSVAPLAGIVMLARGDHAESLTPLGAAEAIRALLPHCFAPHIPPARLLRALQDLARHVPVERLAFSESRRAAALLAERHG